MKKIIKNLLNQNINTTTKELKTRLSTSLSDNQVFPNFCLKASNDLEVFNSFRQHPAYTPILEHVSPNQGKQYLDEISKDKEILAKIEEYKKK